MTTIHLDPSHDIQREISDHSGPGVSFELHGGVYEQSISSFAGPTRGGTRWDDKCLIRARLLKGVPEEVILRPPSGAEKVIELAGSASSWIELDDLFLDGRNVQDNALKITHRGALEIGDHAHHVRIRRCKIANSPYSAAMIDGDAEKSGHELIECETFGAGRVGRPETSHGLYVSCGGVFVADHASHHNTGWGLHNYDGSGMSRANLNEYLRWRTWANGTGGLVIDQGRGNYSYGGDSRDEPYGVGVREGSVDARIVSTQFRGNAIRLYIDPAAVGTVERGNVSVA